MNIRRICESEVADNIPADNEFRAGSNLPNSQRFALCQRIMATTKLGAIQAEAVIDLVLQALRERNMNCKTCGKPAVVGELYVGGRCAVCLAAENERLLKALRAIVEWEASEGSGTTEPTVEQAEWYMRIMAMAVEALALAEKETP